MSKGSHGLSTSVLHKTSARTLLPKGDEKLSQPWKGDQMREEEDSI